MTTTTPDPAERLLLALRDNVVALATETPNPPSWIRIAAGDTAVELSWDGTSATPTVPAQQASVPVAPVPLGEDGPAAVEPQDGTHHIEAPTVGVFYHAPEPGAAPFVSVGDIVAPGQQVGIVEAMKLMIPVEASRAGRVTGVLVADGTSVEYGEPLLACVPLGAE